MSVVGCSVLDVPQFLNIEHPTLNIEHRIKAEKRNLRTRRRQVLPSAPKKPAEEIAVARDAAVNFFRDPNHSGNPEQQRKRDQQRNSQRDETKTPRGAINFPVLRNAMHGFQQIFAPQCGCEFSGMRIGNALKSNGVEPIEAFQQPRLGKTKRTLVIVDHDVCCFAIFHAIKYPRL